jgi:hypothetical protein
MAISSWANDVFCGVEGPETSVETSKLIYHLNLRNFQVVRAEFSKWCLLNGRINFQVVKQRVDDQRLFMGEYE